MFLLKSFIPINVPCSLPASSLLLPIPSQYNLTFYASTPLLPPPPANSSAPHFHSPCTIDRRTSFLDHLPVTLGVTVQSSSHLLFFFFFPFSFPVFCFYIHCSYVASSLSKYPFSPTLSSYSVQILFFLPLPSFHHIDPF